VKKIATDLDEKWVIAETSNERAIKRFMEENQGLGEAEGKEEDSSVLCQSDFLQKNYLFNAKASSMKQAQELIEKNVSWIELC